LMGRECAAGLGCEGDSSRPCNSHACDTVWGAWEECSEPCGGGTQTRACEGTGECEGAAEQACNTDVCAEWSDWGPCSEICDGGNRTRTCEAGDCVGEAEQACNMHACGGINDEGACIAPCFSAWSACSEACGGGTQSRTCEQGSCYGVFERPCNTAPCSAGSKKTIEIVLDGINLGDLDDATQAKLKSDVKQAVVDAMALETNAIETIHLRSTNGRSRRLSSDGITAIAVFADAVTAESIAAAEVELNREIDNGDVAFIVDGRRIVVTETVTVGDLGFSPSPSQSPSPSPSPSHKDSASCRPCSRRIGAMRRLLFARSSNQLPCC